MSAPAPPGAGNGSGGDEVDLATRLAEAERRNSELREELAAARTARRKLAAKLANERYLRARQAVAHAGLDRYLLVPRPDGSRPFVPGYARNPDFLRWRRQFVDDLTRREWVRGSDRVLDVGCGIGAVAALLIDVLDSGGSYAGVDVLAAAIEEAQRNIASQHSNFSFHAIDVWSGGYNREATVQPSEYRFEFGDDEFDVAILRSVFTHMLPADVDHYLQELGRVIKPGGRTAITFFLLDFEAEQALAAGTTKPRFEHARNGHRLDDVETEEAAVAIDEGGVLAGYDAGGFEVVEIQRGNWRTGSNDHPFQDVVYARRR